MLGSSTVAEPLVGEHTVSTRYELATFHCPGPTRPVPDLPEHPGALEAGSALIAAWIVANAVFQESPLWESLPSCVTERVPDSASEGTISTELGRRLTSVM